MWLNSKYYDLLRLRALFISCDYIVVLSLLKKSNKDIMILKNWLNKENYQHYVFNKFQKRMLFSQAVLGFLTNDFLFVNCINDKYFFKLLNNLENFTVLFYIFKGSLSVKPLIDFSSLLSCNQHLQFYNTLIFNINYTLLQSITYLIIGLIKDLKNVID